MGTAPASRPSASGRMCGIALKLGTVEPCPPEGCSLLHALGEQLPVDDDVVCPVEQLGRGDNALVLWTLDALRRELERDPDAVAAPRFEQNRRPRHTDIMRRWS